MRCLLALLISLGLTIPLGGDEPMTSPGLQLPEFRPEPALVVKQTLLTRARFPVIDVHTHFHFKIRNIESLADYVAIMDRNGIAGCISLDAPLGESLAEHIAFLRPHEKRFAVFAHIDFRGSGRMGEPATWDVQREDFVHRTVENLHEAKRQGALGLKLFKNFGLELRDRSGELIAIDDPRFDPIWQTCGELGFPVLMHVADPVAFFQPVDAKNERWEELSRHPDWSFHGPQFPSHATLLKQFLAIMARHEKTQFIGAHLANNAENLEELGAWLDRHPNLHVEFASRINELGRQPYSARRFLIRYQDRLLFGTDGPWPEARLRLYWRFLETYDEYFPYSEKEFPPQGFWRIYGVGLPDETLRKIYYENALRLIPALRERLVIANAE